MLPPRTIVVGTDFSECAAAALAAGADLARTCDARIVLVHVLADGDRPYVALADDDLVSAVSDGERRLAERELDRASQNIVGVPLRAELLDGPVVATLLGVAEANEADLIVVGTHGRTGFRRLLAGSVAEAIVRRSPVPVLTVRPERARPPSA